MIDKEDEFKKNIKSILLYDSGISIESEGTIYIRSLEGNNIASGILSDDGSIESEIEFGLDINKAIEYFCRERDTRSHGD